MKNKKLYIVGIALSVLMFWACDDYLDKLPDNRTTVDTPEKVGKMLVSAYSAATPIMAHEFMSDNYMDNGARFDFPVDLVQEYYLFKVVTSATSQDTPYYIWYNNYDAILAANTALEGIQNMLQHDLSAYKGEALLCRAYAHFTLVNTFCQAYNTESSGTDLGVPYIEWVEESSVESVHDRETVAEVYRKINRDIEEGLPLISDNVYTQVKYHFNTQAAYAFAAQFNLYYGNYDKAVEYATKALGTTPQLNTRDFSGYGAYTSPSEITNAWNNAELATNLFVQTQYSLFGRRYNRAGTTNVRYGHSTTVQQTSVKSYGPWGNKYLYYGQRSFGTGSYNNRFPKIEEYFVYTDVAQGTGQARLVLTPFTVDKTLIDRAEAYVMQGEYDKAAADLSIVYVGGTGAAATADEISAFYANPDNSKYLLDINPRFTVSDGMQRNMIMACLHLRRIVTIHEGDRFRDLKRYGVRFVHNVDEGTNIQIEPFDKRVALQLPSAVTSVGVTPNPR